MSINELKSMSEKERILWFSSLKLPTVSGGTEELSS